MTRNVLLLPAACLVHERHALLHARQARLPLAEMYASANNLNRITVDPNRKDRYGVPLPSITANLYRDGNDSVAWHGDRIGLTGGWFHRRFYNLGNSINVLVDAAADLECRRDAGP